MFRTRDFVLVSTTVAFLLMAIGVTLFRQWQGVGDTSPELLAVVVQDDTYTAESIDMNQFSRAEKLQMMREKIAASSQLSITAPEPMEVVDEVLSGEENQLVEGDVAAVQLCPGYTTLAKRWSPVDVMIEEVEGARLVYRSLAPAPVVPQPKASSSVMVAAEPQREILAQLPVRNFPAPNSSCIASDVIGIATDGSLIRNNEARVYGIFDSNTLVGWALDGFPIYGASRTPTDACGGVMAVDGYRYQISSDRETIINCFSAAPIRL